MVPFDSRSAFVTSGIRVGTAAVTTRGFKEEHCVQTVDWIDEILSNYTNDALLLSLKQKINGFMQDFPLYQ